MKTILDKLFGKETLTNQEAFDVLCSIGNGEVKAAQLASFMTVYRMREISLQELKGFREALVALAKRIELPSENAIDLCGTGGDGRNSFNVSTLASFVVAGAGGKVVKHGNYGVSSISGSSTVLEQLGYIFTSDSSELERSLDECGICFLHAPLFHPALKYVSSVRKELGVHTFFNMLGPLVNPAQPKHRLTGVYSLELLRKYHYLLQESNEIFTLVSSEDGYDEISLTSPCRIVTPDKEFVLEPSDYGFVTYSEDDLFGGNSAAEASRIFTNVLEGKGTQAQIDVVAINAGSALLNLGVVLDLESGIGLAKEVLVSGKALNSFRRFISLGTNRKMSI